MILHIYANLNNEGEFFSSPIFEKITPEEISKDYIQLITGLDQSLLKKLSVCDLYCLGTFDNVSGEIVPKKEFLLHCSEATSRLIKDGVEKGEASA